MKNMSQFSNKQIALNVPASTSSWSSEASTAYSICNGRFKLERSNGDVIEVPLSERSSQLVFIASLSESEDAVELIFPCTFSPFIENLLVRYICDERDPIPTFPALTTNELSQFARIETMIGGNNTAFWESYGFQDAHTALSILLEAQDIYIARQQGSELPSSSALGTTLSAGFDLPRKSIEDLKAIRLRVPTEVLPFVYGAMRDRLAAVAIERDEIITMEMPEPQKILHLKWLYQARKDALTPEVLAEERTMIFRTVYYSDGVTSYMDEPFWREHKIEVMQALYQAYIERFTPESIATESYALLGVDNTEARLIIDALQKLYEISIEKFSPDMIPLERTKLWTASILFGNHDTSLQMLYVSIAPHLTAPRIVSERTAILESTKMLVPDRFLAQFGTNVTRRYEEYDYFTPSKEKSLVGLYEGGRSHLKGDFLYREIDAIWESSALNNNEKIKVINTLCSTASPNLSANIMVRERHRILQARVANRYKSELITTLYRAAVKQFTPDLIESETITIQASAIEAYEQNQLLTILQEIGRSL